MRSHVSLAGLLCSSLMVLLPATAGAQQSQFRVLATSDEFTGEGEDARVVILSSGWRVGAAGEPSPVRDATLIIACGNRLPSDHGRTILLYAGRPLEPFGDEYAQAEARFDGGGRTFRYSLALFEAPRGPGRSAAAGGRQVAFVGSGARRYYAPDLLDLMLKSSSMSLSYVVLGEGRRTVTFPLAGLPEQLKRLSACAWGE